MKTCPVCQAISFDDAKVCYGCLHSFEQKTMSETTDGKQPSCDCGDFAGPNAEGKARCSLAEILADHGAPAEIALQKPQEEFAPPPSWNLKVMPASDGRSVEILIRPYPMEREELLCG